MHLVPKTMPILQKVLATWNKRGVKGTKTITWDITLTDGKETARTKKSEKVTKEPVEEIIEVGTKKTGVETKETVTVEEKVAFKEETRVDPVLDKGQTRVEEGEEGIDEVTYEVTKVDGVEKSRKEVSRKTKKSSQKQDYLYRVQKQL